MNLLQNRFKPLKISMENRESQNKPEKPDKTKQKGSSEKARIEEVKAEEIRIDDQESHQDTHHFGPGKGKRIQFQTVGCLGAILSLVVVIVLFTVLLPVGILALILVTGYFSWKMRKMRR